MRFHRLALLVSAFAVFAVTLFHSSDAEARRRVYRTGPRARVYTTGAVVLAPVHWYVGAGLVGTSILDQSGGPERLESGGGVNLWGGLQLNQRLALELGWIGSFHNPTPDYYYGGASYLVLEGVTADAKIFFDRSGQFSPYLQGGVGVYVLGYEGDYADSVGTGFQLGGGFDYWIGDVWTFGVRARYHGIAMGPPGSDGTASYNDTFINAATLEGSLGLHF